MILWLQDLHEGEFYGDVVLLTIIDLLHLAVKMLNHEITFGCAEIMKLEWSPQSCKICFADSNTCFNMFSTFI